MPQRKHRKTISLLLIFCLLLSCLPGGTIAQTTEAEPQASAAPTTAVTPADTFQLDADCQILRYVDEAVFTAGNHVARLTEQETLDTYVFLNADGTQTVYYMDENVKFLDENGVAREKDITLTASTAGFTTARNNVGLSLPTNLAQGITISYGGYDVNLIPENIAAATAVQQDGKIAYLNCYGKGTGLIYTPTLSGVKEDILLGMYTEVNSFSFLLNTDGLSMYQNEQGRWYLAQSANAAAKMEMADIVAYDANSRHSLGSITVTTITAGQQYRLTVTVDEDFLTAETTAYPVLIDPTITVSDTLTGANAIEDATIYQGKPNVNNGMWTENYAGYYNSEFGVGRTVVRLTSLLSNSTYQSVAASRIQSATFYLTESSNTASVQVNLFPLNSNSTWTESTVTWNNVGTFDNVLQDSQAMGYNNTYQFNITNLVKAWKNGSYSNGQCGFILALHEELETEKSFYSSEYSTTSKRPYVAVTYSLTNEYVSVDKTQTVTLSTEGLSGTITWASSNASVATVNNGVVTGIEAGQATVTATINNEVVKRVIVYVTIPDGDYLIRLQNYEYYLTPSTISYASNTPLLTNIRSTHPISRLSQIWHIKYVSNGYYTISTLYKDDLRLIGNDGYSPVLSTRTIGDEHKWTIRYDQTGYVLQTAAYTDCTLTGPGTGGSLASLADYNGSDPKQKWVLTPTDAEGIMLLDSETGERMDTDASDSVFEIYVGESKTLAQLGLDLHIFDPDNASQAFSLSTSPSNIASFNLANNRITGDAPGAATATIVRVIGTDLHTVSFSIACYKEIYVVNYYDVTLENNTTVRNYIDDAVSFLNTVFGDYYLSFIMDGTPLLYTSSPIALCENGANGPCSTNPLGNCYMDEDNRRCYYHHKNVHRISDTLRDNGEDSHVYVLWSHSSGANYCYEANNTYEHTTFDGARAAVSRNTDAVVFFEIDHINDSYCLGSMSVLLAHEIVHTLGMDDVYSEEHDGADDYQCIMEYVQIDDLGDYFGRINDSANPKDTAFCSSCISALDDLIPNHDYSIDKVHYVDADDI